MGAAAAIMIVCDNKAERGGRGGILSGRWKQSTRVRLDMN
jgi:hypothetical protein